MRGDGIARLGVMERTELRRWLTRMGERWDTRKGGPRGKT